jgi:hypothetical protein
MAEYNEKAVQEYIDRDTTISKGEAQLIHGLLKGRSSKRSSDNDAAVEQAQEDAYQDNEARRIGLI